MAPTCLSFTRCQLQSLLWSDCWNTSLRSTCRVTYVISGHRPEFLVKVETCWECAGFQNASPPSGHGLLSVAGIKGRAPDRGKTTQGTESKSLGLLQGLWL